jgi:DNA-binding response OmpR family regulator
MYDALRLTQRIYATSATPRSLAFIRLSLDTQTASPGDRELNLTRREFDLIDTFLQASALIFMGFRSFLEFVLNLNVLS